MQVYKIIKNNTQDISKIQEILNIPSIPDINIVLNYIFNKRFQAPGSKDGEIVFDYLIDFDLIYALFLKDYGIDLIKQDIGWWQFTAMFEEITLNSNALTKRIGYRAYKVPINRTKGDEEEVKFYLNKKLQYQIEADTTNQLGKMFKSLEKR